jgi:hypothetical protein
MKWKVGDWCLFEHEVQQIKEMEGERVTSVSDGSFSLSGRDLTDRCWPMSLAGKRAADYFEHESSALHREGGVVNWPDLARAICERFDAAMAVIDDEKRLDAVYKSAAEFFKEIRERVREQQQTVVGGVRLFVR